MRDYNWACNYMKSKTQKIQIGVANEWGHLPSRIRFLKKHTKNKRALKHFENALAYWDAAHNQVDMSFDEIAAPVTPRFTLIHCESEGLRAIRSQMRKATKRVRSVQSKEQIQRIIKNSPRNGN